MYRSIKSASLIILFILVSFWSYSQTESKDTKLVDPQATQRTRNLYVNLKNMAGSHLWFGHQDDLAYGVGWVNEKGRSDVKDVTGSYPAVYGWDISGISKAMNIDGVNFENMKNWIREGFKRKGVITISWHMENPVTRTHSWDTTRAVKHIIPGGYLHKAYKAKLDSAAAFFKELKNIPMIFRPFHEHTGSWFWWGDGNATAEEYIALWQFTVHYLRDVKGIHNLLYTYSPDKFKSKEEYLKFYPGDNYVDILGVDDYQGLTNLETAKQTITRLHILYDIAREHDKVTAITETGTEKIPDSEWWTGVLLKTIRTDEKTKNVTWVLVWRNANTDHYYAPYKGHPSSDDFVRFKNDPYVYFGDEMPDLYKKPK